MEDNRDRDEIQFNLMELTKEHLQAEREKAVRQLAQMQANLHALQGAVVAYDRLLKHLDTPAADAKKED